jgi:hypothetical protein
MAINTGEAFITERLNLVCGLGHRWCAPRPMDSIGRACGRNGCAAKLRPIAAEHTRKEPRGRYGR